MFVLFFRFRHPAFIVFLMIRLPPRSTQSRSSAASDVYKRQLVHLALLGEERFRLRAREPHPFDGEVLGDDLPHPVSYTHLRAHETVLDLVCRLLLEKKKS